MSRVFERAKRDACETFQVFCMSPRQWRPRRLAADERQRFIELARSSRMGPLAAHASYLINAASPPGPMRRRSIEALRREASRCHELAIPFLILHPGSHVGAGEAIGVQRVADALDRVLDSMAPDVTLLLENTAGQGACIGHLFAHLRDIISASRHQGRIAICLDTQHAFAAGYDLRARKGYEATFAEIERTVGMEKLRAFHLNDSKVSLGSRVDRHENIGLGQLGPEPFRRLVNDRRFARLPGYLETPPFRGRDSFARNLTVLRDLIARRLTPR